MIGCFNLFPKTSEPKGVNTKMMNYDIGGLRLTEIVMSLAQNKVNKGIFRF